MPGFTPRQLCHWGPVVAITLMLTVIVSASYSAAQLYGLPTVPWITIPHFVEIYFESGWILYLYYKALLGPGFVPPGWKPVSSAVTAVAVLLSLVRSDINCFSRSWCKKGTRGFRCLSLYVVIVWLQDEASDTRFLQFCTFCNGYKAPRSHHCRSCGG